MNFYVLKLTKGLLQVCFSYVRGTALSSQVPCASCASSSELASHPLLPSSFFRVCPKCNSGLWFFRMELSFCSTTRCSPAACISQGEQEMHRPSTLSEWERQCMIAYHENGASIRQISRLIARSRSSVQRVIHKHMG